MIIRGVIILLPAALMFVVIAVAQSAAGQHSQASTSHLSPHALDDEVYHTKQNTTRVSSSHQRRSLSVPGTGGGSGTPTHVVAARHGQRLQFQQPMAMPAENQGQAEDLRNSRSVTAPSPPRIWLYLGVAAHFPGAAVQLQVSKLAPERAWPPYPYT